MFAYAVATMVALCAFPIEPQLAQPVIFAGVPAPTRDKPQSKLWHAHGKWWALLPSKSGSAIWRRDAKGWVELAAARPALHGLPAWGDVECVGDVVYAVLVERSPGAHTARLLATTLRYRARHSDYQVDSVATIEPSAAGIETATVAADSQQQRVWAAYTQNCRVLVRHASMAGGKWSQATVVAESIHKDDICSLGRDRDSVFVVWSDQRKDAVECCIIRTDAADAISMTRTTIAAGGKIADDHLNVRATLGGRVLVASKNSVDSVGKPQLALHARDAAGRWRTHSYLPLEIGRTPSRPMLAIAPADGRMFAIHTLYVRSAGQRRDWIECLTTSVDQPDLTGPATPLIRAAVPINDATGSKQLLPPDLPWLILASDALGNVYEGVLPK